MLLHKQICGYQLQCSLAECRCWWSIWGRNTQAICAISIKLEPTWKVTPTSHLAYQPPQEWEYFCFINSQHTFITDHRDLTNTDMQQHYTERPQTATTSQDNQGYYDLHVAENCENIYEVPGYTTPFPTAILNNILSLDSFITSRDFWDFLKVYSPITMLLLYERSSSVLFKVWYCTAVHNFTYEFLLCTVILAQSQRT